MKNLLLLLLIIASSCSKGIRPVNSRVSLVDSSFSFTEGPAVNSLGEVFFTDQPNNKIFKWTETEGVSLFMNEASRSNGLYFNEQNELFSCADELNELVRFGKNGKKEVLLNSYNSAKFNGPNDLWIAQNGDIYFTDPFYKRPWWQHQEKPQETQGFYVLRKNSDKADLLDSNFKKANGIVGTANQKLLYVADIGANKTYVYHLKKDGSVIRKPLEIPLGSDGMTIDKRGNVYLTGKGVTVFNKKGRQIDHIEVPENWTANVCFGGKNKDILFITASKSVYTIKMNVRGD